MLLTPSLPLMNELLLKHCVMFILSFGCQSKSSRPSKSFSTKSLRICTSSLVCWICSFVTSGLHSSSCYMKSVFLCSSDSSTMAVFVVGTDTYFSWVSISGFSGLISYMPFLAEPFDVTICTVLPVSSKVYRFSRSRL